MNFLKYTIFISILTFAGNNLYIKAEQEESPFCEHKEKKLKSKKTPFHRILLANAKKLITLNGDIHLHEDVYFGTQQDLQDCLKRTLHPSIYHRKKKFFDSVSHDFANTEGNFGDIGQHLASQEAKKKNLSLELDRKTYGLLLINTLEALHACSQKHNKK